MLRSSCAWNTDTTWTCKRHYQIKCVAVSIENTPKARAHEENVAEPIDRVAHPSRFDSWFTFCQNTIHKPGNAKLLMELLVTIPVNHRFHINSQGIRKRRTLNIHTQNTSNSSCGTFSCGSRNPGGYLGRQIHRFYAASIWSNCIHRGPSTARSHRCMLNIDTAHSPATYTPSPAHTHTANNVHYQCHPAAQWAYKKPETWYVSHSVRVFPLESVTCFLLRRVSVIFIRIQLSIEAGPHRE